ncbi:MAG TPA: alpha/beta hydrolase, partial [Ktedonobacteraceae bacterium]|nr:alpha/beta hydrolase [Ktedonobacteraceae bacterium]
RSHKPGEEDNNLAQPSNRRIVRLIYGPETLQFGELYLPAGSGPFPVVMLIHGGFWRNPYGYTLMTGLAEDLARRGMAAWNIEYRRVGDAGGGWPSTLTDVARAADYMRAIAPNYALDWRRVVSVGHSAGGHLALWLAGRPRIAQDSILAGSSFSGKEKGMSDLPLPLVGAVSQAGVADLEMGWRLNLGSGAVAQLLGGSVKDVPERYAAASPAALLPLGVPQVLIHGTEDDRVPYAMSETYTRAARAAGDQVTLIKLKGADHFALIDVNADAWAKTVEAVRKLLHLE